MSKVFDQLRVAELQKRLGSLSVDSTTAVRYVSVGCFAAAAPACVAGEWKLAGAFVCLAVALRFLAYDLERTTV